MRRDEGCLFSPSGGFPRTLCSSSSKKHLDQSKWLPKGSTCARRSEAGGRKPGR